MGKFFKTGKAAKILGVTQRTLKRWAKNGTLVPVKTAENGYHFYSESQLREFKTRDLDVIPSVQNSAGDSYKPMTFSQTYDKTYDIGEKTASEQASGNVAVEKTRYLLPEIDTIPPKILQKCDKNGDTDEKTASEQASS